MNEYHLISVKKKKINCSTILSKKV